MMKLSASSAEPMFGAKPPSSPTLVLWPAAESWAFSAWKISEPMRSASATFAEALRMGSEIFHALKAQLSAAGHNTNVGDEGGFAPNIGSAEEALSFIMQAGEKAGYKAERDFVLGLD